MEKFNYSECVSEHDGYAVTKDGRKVRLLCNDAGSGYSIVGLLGEDKQPFLFARDGSHLRDSESTMDLFTPSKRIKRSYWVNVYGISSASVSRLYKTKNIADGYAGSARLACVEVKIECEEGEGLD